MESTQNKLLKSLGFPSIQVHTSLNHFDFSIPSRRILVIGPMGSGKTEYSARVWRDSKVALKKSEKIAALTTTEEADRRQVFFIRSILDGKRFAHYPEDALAYRGGYEKCGKQIARINNSEELESIIQKNHHIGTWIIDEASFYDERLAYVVKEQSISRGLVFIYPTLILNFRKEIFNSTAQLLLETATDVILLTAYCEHNDCLEDSFYTYRYYQVKGEECPALFFDPLIVVGGDREKDDPGEPNYCTRCDLHHYLPGKEYAYLILKHFGEKACKGNSQPLVEELFLLKNDIPKSLLYQNMKKHYLDCKKPQPINMNALKVPNIAEKALIYLFAEQNLLTEEMMKQFVNSLQLDREYISRVCRDNRRHIDLEQLDLPF